MAGLFFGVQSSGQTEGSEDNSHVVRLPEAPPDNRHRPMPVGAS